MPEGHWDGHTYYGRQQLKPAPFNNVLVGSYVFLAGLSGAAQLLSLVIDLRHGRGAAVTVRRGRYLAMLVPTLGTACLIFDLHTPQRFYNMLRVFKTTSPMSFGSWTLVGFSGVSTITAVLQFALDKVQAGTWPRTLARLMHVPGALLGGVLATYTASLFAATSTPRWAATPVTLAVRYASASIASAVAALRICEDRRDLSRSLDGIAIVALATELAATLTGEEAAKRVGVGEAASECTNVMAILVPLGLFALSLLGRRPPRWLSTAASVGVLAGSLAMRINVISEGEGSARSPELSMRFAQPENLPAMSSARHR